jgi:Spy/CpxP family protein refolding chaperone
LNERLNGLAAFVVFLENMLFSRGLHMRPSFSGRVLAALVLVAFATPAAAQGFSWWKDERVVRELGLSADQSTRIESVFRGTFPQQRQNKEELDRQEAELSRLIEINADEAQVVRQVDRVEAVRASLNRTRTLTLLHMRQVLTAKQNVKFKAVYEQWRRDNPRPPRPPDGRD